MSRLTWQPRACQNRVARSTARGSVVRRRGEDANAAGEQVGRGVLDPLLLGPGERMGADEPDVVGQPAVQLADDGPLGAAGVGEQGPRHGVVGRLADLPGDPIDRGAEDDHVGRADADGQVGGELVDGPEVAGPGQGFGVPADADDPAGGRPGLRGEPDRPPDQPDPDDGERVKEHAAIVGPRRPPATTRSAPGSYPCSEPVRVALRAASRGPMNGSKKELEQRVQAAERLLREMEASLARTKRLIEEARQILDESATHEADDEPTE